MNRNSNNASSTSRAPASGRGDAKPSEDYFDLHVKGAGYLSRIRDVGVRGGRDSFLACAINALHGQCSAPSYSYFDLKVSGQEAQTVVRNLWEAVDEGRKVFIAFRAGDIYADPYEVDEKDRDTGRPTGRKITRASIKGRLLLITHAKVDGEVVYQADTGDGDGDGGTDLPVEEQGSSGVDDGGVGTAQADDSQMPARNEGQQRTGSQSRSPAPQRDEPRRFDRTRDRAAAAA